jgi:hypothetical protein
MYFSFRSKRQHVFTTRVLTGGTQFPHMHTFSSCSSDNAHIKICVPSVKLR